MTYKELQDELIEEAHLLLGMAMGTSAKDPNADVPDTEIEQLRAQYHADGSDTTKTLGRGRGKVTCGG